MRKDGLKGVWITSSLQGAYPDDDAARPFFELVRDLDLVCYHAPAARCSIETMGADRILFGTDAPPLTVLKCRGLAMVDDLAFTPADKEKILSGNARKLLKLQ